MAAESGTPGDELIGRTLGDYKIESRLGSGATGVVFRAQHPTRPVPVALKVLHDNLGSITSLKRRFEREARVLSKLDHPNVVYITDFGVVDGHTFIAMELLEGETLEQVLEQEPIDPKRAIAITKEILAGLAFAHARKVVHRDLKPANVFLCRGEQGEDVVKLLDFGLAKMLSVDDLSQDGTLTRKGRIVGTPAYMAPEQITGVSLDVRADVYSLGILLYELIADRRPFLSERRSELLRAHLLEPVPPITEARKGLVVAAPLEALILKALAKDPADRYADAAEMLAAMESVGPNPVRLASEKKAVDDRVRTAPTSEIISSSERRAVSESARIAGEPTPAGGVLAESSDPSPEEQREAARDIKKALHSRPPPQRDSHPRLSSGTTAGSSQERGPSTPVLYATAVGLFALAAVLWWTLGAN